MSLASEINRNNYPGTGATNVFNYTFKIFNEDHITVIITDVNAATETTLVKNTDYTVSGVNNTNGGSITLIDAGQAWLSGGNLAVDFIISLRRIVPLTQETDIRNQGDSYAEAHEDQFDLLVMANQQQQDEIDRSIKLPESILASDFDTSLPPDINTPGRAIMINSTGDGFTIGATVSAGAMAQDFSNAIAAVGDLNLGDNGLLNASGVTNGTGSFTFTNNTEDGGTDYPQIVIISDTSSFSKGEYGRITYLSPSDSAALGFPGEKALNITVANAVDIADDFTSSMFMKSGDARGTTVLTGDTGYWNARTGHFRETSQGVNTGDIFLNTGSARDTSVLSGRTGQAQLTTGRIEPGATAVSTGPILLNTGDNQNSSISATTGDMLFTSGDNEGIGGQTGDMEIRSGDNNNGSNADPSGSVTIRTGTTFGSGDSGTIRLQTGTSFGGARGSIQLAEGSEGTVGHVWTSYGVNGEGQWQSPYKTIRSIGIVYTLDQFDEVIFASSGGGGYTINLHTAVGYNGKEVIIKKVTNDANVLTIDPAGAETIDGSATQVVDNFNEVLHIISDGANWQILNRWNV